MEDFIDLRIKKTKKTLMEAILELLNKKYNHQKNITVLQICQYAKINISTFYKHFDNKENLLAFTWNEKINDFLCNKSNWWKQQTNAFDNIFRISKNFIAFCTKYNKILQWDHFCLYQKYLKNSSAYLLLQIIHSQTQIMLHHECKAANGVQVNFLAKLIVGIIYGLYLFNIIPLPNNQIETHLEKINDLFFITMQHDKK